MAEQLTETFGSSTTKARRGHDSRLPGFAC